MNLSSRTWWAAELIDQIRFTPQPEYVFHHPLIRMVAYESQLKSDRAALHRRLAAAIEARDQAAADENAALIAEHLEAAGDLHAAYGWHMRAGSVGHQPRHRRGAHELGTCASARRRAARRRPGPAGDALVPLTLLCGTVWRCRWQRRRRLLPGTARAMRVSGDNASLAMGMAGLVMALAGRNRLREASAAGLGADAR